MFKAERKFNRKLMNKTDVLLDDLKLKRLFSCLADTGQESRIVGGAIRDVLCGKTPQEIDLATTALPESVMKAAEKSGYRVVPTGVDHGTVTIIIDSQPFEVTTLRTDVETDGRYAKVTFGNSFEEDAKRRDFTINALSLSESGVIYDYVNGLSDLKAGRVRFIGDPETRIKEDFLRILRFFRFSASHGVGELDPEGLKQCTLAKENLLRLSRERIHNELFKLMVAERAPEILAIMSYHGFAKLLLGETFPSRVKRLRAFEKLSNKQPCALLTLAAFAIITDADVKRLRERLRLSNDEFNRLMNATKIYDRLKESSKAPHGAKLKELLFLFGPSACQDGLCLAISDTSPETDDSTWIEALDFLARVPTPIFPIKTAELITRGIEPGQKLGKALKLLQNAWIQAEFPQDPSILENLTRQVIEDVNKTN